MRLMFKFLKPSFSAGWLSLVMREGRIDIAHVRREPAVKPTVTMADSIERRGDTVAVLKALRKSMHLERHRCSALLTRGNYQLIQAEAVEGPAEEARDVLRWKLKDQVDFPVDSAAIDLLPIPGDGRSSQVFAAMAPASAVTPLVHAFQDADINLAVIDLPEMSQRNLAALFETEGRGLATLIFDDDEGLLTFTQGGELLATRHVEISARQLQTADASRLESLQERIALDVQRSLDNFDRNFSYVPLARLLVAPIPGVDGFVDYLHNNLTVSVEPLSLDEVIDCGAVPALRDPLRRFQALRAIGAALRQEAAAS